MNEVLETVIIGEAKLFAFLWWKDIIYKGLITPICFWVAHTFTFPWQEWITEKLCLGSQVRHCGARKSNCLVLQSFVLSPFPDKWQLGSKDFKRLSCFKIMRTTETFKLWLVHNYTFPSLTWWPTSNFVWKLLCTIHYLNWLGIVSWLSLNL